MLLGMKICLQTWKCKLTCQNLRIAIRSGNLGVYRLIYRRSWRDQSTQSNQKHLLSFTTSRFLLISRRHTVCSQDSKKYQRMCQIILLILGVLKLSLLTWTAKKAVWLERLMFNSEWLRLLRTQATNKLRRFIRRLQQRNKWKRIHTMLSRCRIQTVCSLMVAHHMNPADAVPRWFLTKGEYQSSKNYFKNWTHSEEDNLAESSSVRVSLISKSMRLKSRMPWVPSRRREDSARNLRMSRRNNSSCSMNSKHTP